jgi:hypothetical protein
MWIEHIIDAPVRSHFKKVSTIYHPLAHRKSKNPIIMIRGAIFVHSQVVWAKDAGILD